MKWSESDIEFENPPAGSHLARCYGLIDLGTQSSWWEGKETKRRKVRISFELPYCKMEGKHHADLKGKPFSIHAQLTQSLDRRSTLRQFLEGWRGKRFEAHELESYDPKRLLGLPARLALVENEKGWINIDAISRVTREEQEAMPLLMTPKVYLSLEPDEFDQETFNRLTEKTRNKIMLTPEWARLFNGEPEQDPEPEAQPAEVNEDDTIPF